MSKSKCEACGTITLHFDPPLTIPPGVPCGQFKPGTYTGQERGGVPFCILDKHGDDTQHAYLVEYVDRW